MGGGEVIRLLKSHALLTRQDEPVVVVKAEVTRLNFRQGGVPGCSDQMISSNVDFTGGTPKMGPSRKCRKSGKQWDPLWPSSRQIIERVAPWIVKASGG